MAKNNRRTKPPMPAGPEADGHNLDETIEPRKPMTDTPEPEPEETTEPTEPAEEETEPETTEPADK